MEQTLSKAYRRMQGLLLALAGVIALDQTLLSLLVLAALVAGLRLAWLERKERPLPRLWPRGLKVAALLLLADAYLSLHSPVNAHRSVTTFNFFYVVGQYVVVVWLVSRFGNYFSGRASLFGRDREAGRETKQAAGIPSGGNGTGSTLAGRWRCFRRAPFPLQILGVLAGVAAFVLLGGLAQHVFGGATDALWVDKTANPLLRNRVFSTWENPNIFAGYVCALAAYLMGFISVERNSRRRWGLFGFLLAALLCLVYSFSRGFWAAMAGELVVFVLCFYRRGIIYLIGTAAAAAALAGPAVWQRLATLQHIGSDSSAAMRLAYLDIAEAIVKDHPLGIGWYNYRYIFPEYDYYFKNPDVIMYHCHNLFLNVAAELGVQGLVLFLVVWLVFLYIAWRLQRSARFPWIRALGRGYLLLSLGMCIGGIADHVFFNVRLGVLFWLLSTLLLLGRQYNQYGPEPDPDPDRGARKQEL
ncbi:MAG: O-Antigen ligase [Succiniclasticum sp.]|jgi:putative inorganic carbon (hco3(-)) transporter